MKIGTISGALMVLFAGMAAACAVAAWLGLAAVAILWAMQLGLPLLSAIILIAAVNLLAAAVMILAGLRMSRNLLFPATRRRIAGKQSVLP